MLGRPPHMGMLKGSCAGSDHAICWPRPSPSLRMCVGAGDIPNSNIAFMADAIASTMGGLLGSSAIVCYVESAAGMREGGRTGGCHALHAEVIECQWPLLPTSMLLHSCCC